MGNLLTGVLFIVLFYIFIHGVVNQSGKEVSKESPCQEVFNTEVISTEVVHAKKLPTPMESSPNKITYYCGDTL